MEKAKVFVADPISPRGVEELKDGGLLEVTVATGLAEEDLIGRIAGYQALVVRSQTKVSTAVMDAAKELRVVGRAGVGVDNVDVEAATKRGIIVMNTPGGNTVSTAEHAFSLMVSTARKIPQADASMKAGRWDRKKFEGVELYGKNLAILGMGRIGTELARRAIAFGMRVFAYDPYLAASKARSMQVELMESLEEILPLADFISMHMPLTDETRHMLDRERLDLCKKGVRIVNCARGGLIDEIALSEALQSGHVAAAALDVYETEPPPEDFPLRKLDSIVLTPHLGASTAEAQESVGIEIAAAIRAALLEGEIRNAVNVPSIDSKTLALLGPWIDLAQKLGLFLAQIGPKRVENLRFDFSGKISEQRTLPLSRSALTGFLRWMCGPEINQVNAPSKSDERGIKVVDTRSHDAGEFSELIELTAEGSEGSASVAGTFFGSKARIVKVNGRFVETSPRGVILMLENEDRPGIVGHVGTVLGEFHVNIANMSLSRNEAGGSALVLLNLDSEPPEEATSKLLQTPEIISVKVVRL